MGSKRSKPVRPRADDADSYFTRIVTYIPTEIIAAYVAISGFIKSLTGAAQFPWFCTAALALLIITPVYVFYAADAKEKPAPVGQAAASAVAFAAWVFANGGPFNGPGNSWLYQPEKNLGGWYQPVMGSIVLIFVCVSLPLIQWFVSRRIPG